MPNSPLKLQQSILFQDLSAMDNNKKILTINSQAERHSLEVSSKIQPMALENGSFIGSNIDLKDSFGSPDGLQESESSKINLKSESDNLGDNPISSITSEISEKQQLKSQTFTLKLEHASNGNSVQTEELDFSDSESESEPEKVKPNSYIKIKTSALFNKTKRPRPVFNIPVKSKTSYANKNKSKSSGSDSDSELSESFSKTSSRSSFSNSPICEALELRQRNINERDAFLKSLLIDPEFAEAVENIGIFKQKQEKPSSTLNSRKKRRHSDQSFRFTGYIPLEPRKSLRLQDKEPIFKYDDLVDEIGCSYSRRRKRTNSSDDDCEYKDLEKVVHRPRKRTNHQARAIEKITFLNVDDVTENMIKGIAWKVSDKEYSTAGSCCHQCRQKTLDTKTFCRDKYCIGVRGQFCGVCLENRYGENAAVALKDPDWRCPVCRDICNCSFCRSKAGKRPTGILAPMAQRTGHKSVKDFLDSLRGEGDYTDEAKNPSKLLGFSDDLKYAQMGGDIKHFIGSSTDLIEFKNVITLLEKKLFLH